MTTAAALAARLRAMSDADLTELVAHRTLPSGSFSLNGPTAVTDFFDLAEALRTPESIDAALDRLPRATLAALADPSDVEPLAPAAALALVDGAAVDDVVAARLAARPELVVADRSGGTGNAPDAGTVPDVAGSGVDAVRRAQGIAAERAFGTMTALAELIRRVDTGEVHELAKGGIGAPLARQLAAETGSDVEAVPDRLRFLVRAGLVDAGEHAWTVTDDGRAWLVAPWPDRWADAVGRWTTTLDDPVLDVLDAAGDDWSDPVPLGRWAYPGGSGWLDAALLDAIGVAAGLGVLVDGRVTPTGRALLNDRADDDAHADALRAAAADLPGTVDSVYLQHDLTVIAPGPLSPADDDALRAVADIEAPGIASRYRITEDGVRRALRAGIDREAIVATLGRLSATGVPQPVAYLVDQVSARDGSIVVDRGEGGVGTVVRGPVDQLDLIAVDAELKQIGWQRRGPTVLVSRYPAHVVATALEDQRYPAVLAAAAREAGGPVPPGRRRTQGRNPTEQARELVERLRATTERSDREPEQEWLGRQIDLAVRGKLPITLTVRMPDGTEAPFTIVPTAVSGGRVRGRDVRADVERTLPLSLVVAVTEGR